MARSAQRGAAIAGGVSVLVVTAVFGFWEFNRTGATFAYRVAGLVLLVLLLAGALLLARFVRKHGDEIGEARFDTSEKEEPLP